MKDEKLQKVLYAVTALAPKLPYFSGVTVDYQMGMKEHQDSRLREDHVSAQVRFEFELPFPNPQQPGMPTILVSQCASLLLATDNVEHRMAELEVKIHREFHHFANMTQEDFTSWFTGGVPHTFTTGVLN